MDQKLFSVAACLLQLWCMYAFPAHRAAACAVHGDRPDIPSSVPASHRVSTKIKTRHTSHWESTQGSGTIDFVSVYFVLCFSKIIKRKHTVFQNKNSLLSFFKSVQEPISLVPLPPAPVDLCEIHLELIDDHISTEPCPGLTSSQNPTLKQGSMHSRNLLHYDPSSRAIYWESGGMEQDCSLDSGIGIPPVSLFTEVTCGPSGRWKTDSSLWVLLCKAVCLLLPKGWNRRINCSKCGFSKVFCIWRLTKSWIEKCWKLNLWEVFKLGDKWKP